MERHTRKVPSPRSKKGKRFFRQQQVTPGYHSRASLLREIGFKNYTEYLISPLWKAVRNKAFKLHGRICFLCPKPATSIHHISYTRDNLLGTDYSQLAPLCRICHRRVEFTGKRKLKLFNAQRKYHALRAVRIEQLKALAIKNQSLSPI